MVPQGEADILVVLEPDQIAVNESSLRAGGLLIDPSRIDAALLPNKKSINVALLGVLSLHLPFPPQAWIAALERNLSTKHLEANLQAFALGREA
jgi:indolepyruvate ferredoxin oxidoreductase beta subunit